MSSLVVAAVVVPLIAVAASLMSMRRLAVQRALSVAASAALLVVAAVLVVNVDRDGSVVAAVSGWAPPVGIVLVADRLATLLLVVSALALLLVLLYAIAQEDSDREFAGFHPVYQILAAGVALALLTGDLFTLFVAFEIMLTASYVLLTHRARAGEIRAAISYVVIGLVASALFLTAIALIYGVAGTVNIADLSEALDGVPAATRSGLGWMLFFVFGIKAAIFPLFFWLPDSYPVAPAPVTALFAGLLTKIGVYAILRTQTLLFPRDEPVTLMLVVAGFTMVVGVLGAIAQKDIKRILSFHIVSQIGYMVMGLGLFTVAGLAATIVFVVHQIIVKASLFLVGGLVEQTEGTGAIDGATGVARRSPIIAVLFLPAALSLAGLPPFSGFVGKLGLLSAGLESQRWSIVAVSLLASVLTLVSMTKIWGGVFWGTPPERPVAKLPRGMTAATAVLVLTGLVIAIGAGSLFEFAERAAADMIDPAVYRNSVLGGS